MSFKGSKPGLLKEVGWGLGLRPFQLEGFNDLCVHTSLGGVNPCLDI